MERRGAKLGERVHDCTTLYQSSCRVHLALLSGKMQRGGRTPHGLLRQLLGLSRLRGWRSPRLKSERTTCKCHEKHYGGSKPNAIARRWRGTTRLCFHRLRTQARLESPQPAGNRFGNRCSRKRNTEGIYIN